MMHRLGTVLSPLSSALATPALGLVALGALVGRGEAQRNVLLVIADDLGVDRLASYGLGQGLPPTPTVDALAASGVTFRNCWANPVCSPTRATIQTGRYSFRTGVGNALPFGPPLAQEERTLPEALAELGLPHRSALVGKWHLGGGPLTQGDSLDPNLQGYEHFAGALGGAFAGPFGYELWPRTVDGVTNLSRTYATTQTVDDALAWVDGVAEPWFLTVSFHAPHTPFHAPPAELHGQELPDADPCEQPIPFHDAMVEAFDRELGRLLDTLGDEVLANTVVLLVGDNGTTADVAQPPLLPERSKGTLYQGGIRVPLIVSGPDVVLPGRESLALVNTTDLFATVVELAGGDVAELSGGAPEDTLSLVGVLTSALGGGLRTHTYAELFTGMAGEQGAQAAGEDLDLGGFDPVDVLASGLADTSGGCILGGVRPTPGQTLRDARYKLVRLEPGRDELYDLWTDPDEEVDLLRDGEFDPAALSAYLELQAALVELTGG